MADLKITQLPSASIVLMAGVLPIVQEGITEQVSVVDLGQGIFNNNLPLTSSGITVSGEIEASLQENYIWLGDSEGRSNPVPISNLTSTFPLNYGLFNQTGSSTPISASISELSLIGGGVGTLTVPANAFKQGDAYHAILMGRGTFHNNDTLEVHMKAGDIALADTGVMILSGANNKFWKLEIFFTINNIGAAGVASITSGGTFTYSSDSADKYNGIIFNNVNSSTFDTTINNTLQVTGQFSSILNIMYSDVFTLNKTF